MVFAVYLVMRHKAPRQDSEDKKPHSGGPIDDEKDVKIMATYFPQFHEFDENNKLWGKGFTDFVNVDKVTHNRWGQEIIKPDERGFYNLLSRSQRCYQGNLAREYGIDVFAYYHYHFGSKTIMDTPLRLLLQDGCPNVSFVLNWANEAWTANWDGQFDSEVLLAQVYDESDWEPHFMSLLAYFRHPLHFKINQMPVFMIYRPAEIPKLDQMLRLWQRLARQAGFPGIYFVQVNGVRWTPDAYTAKHGINASVEFFPNYFAETGMSFNRVLRSKNYTENNYYGVSTAFDNTPRHSKNIDKAAIVPIHPSMFQFWLEQNLKRSKPGGFVLVNAWNEWGEGAALEPSVQWGRRWLDAIKAAKDNFIRKTTVPLLESGYPATLPFNRIQTRYGTETCSVCIIILMTDASYDGIFNIHQTLNSLKVQKVPMTITVIGQIQAEETKSILEEYENALSIRFIRLASLSISFIWENVVTLLQKCLGYRDWGLVTESGVSYAAGAFSHCKVSADIVYMNFYSKSTDAIDYDRILEGSDRCCVRLNDKDCSKGAPQPGFSSLASRLFKLDKFLERESKLCTEKSLEECFNRYKITVGNYHCHPFEYCSVFERDNFVSCGLFGGVWVDQISQRDSCHYLNDFGAIQRGNIVENSVIGAEINFEVFYDSRYACICKKRT